ncbi:MAG: iron-sulfur cluster biosynthesis transcriptional regulator SufR, partial [Microcoleaceae cyanobacterium]
GNGSLGDRLNNLVVLRQAEGYMAECHQVEGEAKQAGYIFIEHNCAISNVAESFPSVCGHELEMFSMVLPDCQVERTHSLVEGEHRCGYLITVN